MGVEIKSNKKWYNFIYGYELPKNYRKEFDWIKSDDEYDTSLFVKYRGRVYALNEFMRGTKEMKDEGWDGYISDSFFSGVLIKISSDGEQYKIATYYAKG